MMRLFYGINTELYSFSEIKLREKLIKCGEAEPIVMEVLLEGCEVDDNGIYVKLSHFLGFRFFNISGESIKEIPFYEVESENYLMETLATKIITDKNLDYFDEVAKIERGEEDYWLTLFDCGNTAFFANKNVKKAFSSRGVYIKERK